MSKPAKTIERTELVEPHYEYTQDGRPVLVPGDPTRATCVAGWITWHIPELAGVLVPAGAAVAVSPWAWVASGVVAAGWAIRAVRRALEQAAVRAGRDLPAATDAESDAVESGAVESGVDTVGTRGAAAGSESGAVAPRAAESAAVERAEDAAVPSDGAEVWL